MHTHVHVHGHTIRGSMWGYTYSTSYWHDVVEYTTVYFKSGTLFGAHSTNFFKQENAIIVRFWSRFLLPDLKNGARSVALIGFVIRTTDHVTLFTIPTYQAIYDCIPLLMIKINMHLRTNRIHIGLTERARELHPEYGKIYFQITLFYVFG